MAETIPTSEQKMLCYLITPKLGLMPYLREFIPVYHTWMQDPEILELTASEPLTLAEEQENQLSWLQDPSKYTFIIFSESDSKTLQQPDFPAYTCGYKMAGDINLFFHSYLEDNEAEINVMIGQKSERGKGLAAEAIRIIIDFGAAFYARTRFIAKISSHNAPSIALFKKLGFTLFADIKAFEEVHYEFNTQGTPISREEFLGKYPGLVQIEQTSATTASTTTSKKETTL